LIERCKKIDIIELNNDILKRRENFVSELKEMMNKAIENLLKGESEYFVEIMNYILTSNVGMQFKLIELERELDELKKEFLSKELTPKKFQELLMADDNIED